MRLFFGVELTEAVRTEVRRLQSLLRCADADVRWVRAESAHFTLEFLGDVADSEIQPIDGAARAVADEFEGPIRLRLGGLGTFPNPRRPRVVWAGIEGQTERLRDLQMRLEKALAEVGFPRQRRPFRAHVTLGRVRGSRGIVPLAALLEKHRGVRLGKLDVRHFTLLQSFLSRSGARYEGIATYSLRDGQSSR